MTGRFARMTPGGLFIFNGITKPLQQHKKGFCYSRLSKQVIEPALDVRRNLVGFKLHCFPNVGRCFPAR